jgi:O-antigen ligase
MKQFQSENSFIYNLAYNCFILLLLAVPLVFTVHVGNPIHVTKNDSLIIIGGIFIILTSSLLLYQYKNWKLKTKGLLIDKKIDPYVFLFFISAAISSIFSINPFVSYNGYYTRPLGFEMYLYTFLIYIFSSALLQNEKKIQNVMYVMELSAVIVSIYAFLQFAGMDPFGIQPVNEGRPFGTLGNSVFIGGFLTLVFPFSLMRISQGRKFNSGIVFSLIIACTVIITQTRTAYVAIIIEVIVILLIYPIVNNKIKTKLYKKLKYSFLILGGIFLVLLLVIVLERDNLFVKRFISITSIFQNPRWLLWGESLKVFVKYPVTGCGISTFPIVFEDVYSMKFKMTDVRNYTDNAHSNFFHTLCSMGIVGITAYLMLLVHTVFVLIKSVFSKTLKDKQKKQYIGFLAMICGYIVYGIADFDEITIIFYFFIYMSLLRAFLITDSNSVVFEFPSKSKTALNKGVIAIFVFLFLFVPYNIYISTKQLIADQYYVTAFTFASKGQFQTSLDYFSSAIELWENNSYYHYQYGGALLSYAASDTFLNAGLKNSILEESKSELLAAKENYPSRRDVMALVSIAEYEQGDSVEAMQIKNELLAKDSLMVNYRLELAQFFIKKKMYDKVMGELLFDAKYDPKSKVLGQTITNFLNDNNCPDPKGYCQKILSVDPNNEAANRFIRTRK